MKFRNRKTVPFAFLMIAVFLGGCALCPSRCTDLEKAQAAMLREKKEQLETQTRLAREQLKTAEIENRRLEKKYNKLFQEKS